ncbi:hypothetical protein HanOQP8_Chr10g0361571 [Helianthus annuus]|nr:hypothetical protein HanOQP8_Chr10g0361571 [Helianthus annuus]
MVSVSHIFGSDVSVSWSDYGRRSSYYNTLYADFLHDDNFRLPATNFLGELLTYYQFHISHLSLLGMVRVQHLLSQGIEPLVNRFRVFYQLQHNLGFYSFSMRDGAKKILLAPPNSYHDWKGKFFYIWDGVIPIAMTFRVHGEIEKEDLSMPKGEEWYKSLHVLPNRSFEGKTLVAAGMSDR